MAVRVAGRSGTKWTVRPILLHRPGHVRPHRDDDLAAGRNVDLVHDEADNVHGALRRFRDRAERRSALAFLAAGSPTTPVVLDVVDDPALPPAIVTSWAPGSSDQFLDRLTRYDDLGDLLERGRRFTPSEALRTLVSLGHLLDAVGERGFTPIELSPDHVVYNRGSIRLVGIRRHLCRPGGGSVPDPCGMSLPTTLLLGEDYPGAAANAQVWRAAQVRALLRLAGWMVCGLGPAAWGRALDARDLTAYLRYAGFSEVPDLRPGALAKGLSDAAATEERHEAARRLSTAAAILFHDAPACAARGETQTEWVNALSGRVLRAVVVTVDETQLTARIQTTANDDWVAQVGLHQTLLADAPAGTRLDLRLRYRPGQPVNLRLDRVRRSSAGGWPVADWTEVTTPGDVAPARNQQARMEINPEPVRLGLMVEHGPGVVAVAGFDTKNSTLPLPSMLSGAGWVLVNPAHLAAIGRRLAAHNPGARLVIAGRSPKLLAALTGRHVDVVEPGAADPPKIAARPASELPYLDDVNLETFGADVFGERSGRAKRRRVFAAGWALAWDRRPARRADQAKDLDFVTDQFGTNTELLVAVRIFLNGAGFRSYSAGALRSRVERAASILDGVPAGGPFRRDLMAALFDRTPDDVYDVVAARLLPVAPRLAETYDPGLQLGRRPMDENLSERDGVERVGLFGRLATALPEHHLAGLADIVSRLDARLITALADIPAPSLQHLVGRLRADELSEVLRPLVRSQDLDLLGFYTPTVWELLIDGLRSPEQIGNLGVGWALVVDDDPAGHVDPRAVLDLAAVTGQEGRHVVRLLLDVPAEDRPAVLAERDLAAAWLREFDNLDIAPLLRRFPMAADLVATIGAQALRNALATELDQERLLACCRLADRLGVDSAEVIAALVRLPWEPRNLDDATSLAGTAWLGHLLAEGYSVADALRRLVAHPQALRAWAVNGPALRRRVLTDVLGAPPDDLGLTQTAERNLFATLGTRPGLAQLIRRPTFPEQRLALLRLVADHPDDGVLGRLLREPVHELMASEDPTGCVSLMLEHGLDWSQARLVRRLGLDDTGRSLVRALGPLTATMPDTQLHDLIGIHREHGLACAVATAVAAQWRPELIGLVRSWGPVWLPAASGPDGDRVVRALTGHHPPTGAGWYPGWLAAAGWDGLRLLERHGARGRDVIVALRPPVADVRLVHALLDGPDWPVERMYPLVVRYGLPMSCWPALARHVAVGLSPDDVLLELWDASTRPAGAL